MNLVTKDARRATRIVKGGQKELAFLKKKANRCYRHQIHQRLNTLVDFENFDEVPTRLVTGWDIA
jgi:hypothetical protein